MAVPAIWAFATFAPYPKTKAKAKTGTMIVEVIFFILKREALAVSAVISPEIKG